MPVGHARMSAGAANVIPGFLAAMVAAVGSGNAITINKHALVADGQVLLAAILTTGTAVITAPDGWTALPSSPQLSSTSSSSARLYCYQKVADDEGDSWTFTASGSNREILGAVLAYSAVDTSDPIDASAGDIDSGADDFEVGAPAITTTQPNTRVVFLGGWNPGSPVVGMTTPPTGMTERVDIQSTGATRIGLTVADYLKATPGSTGTKTAVPSIEVEHDAAILVALAPA